MLRVIHLENSRSDRVIWLLEELGLDYEVELHERDPETHRAPEAMKKQHPYAHAPMLRDGDRVLIESGAIVEYVLARYGAGSGFWPDGPAVRATADMWAEWGKTTLCPAFTAPIFWSRVRTAAKDRDEAALTAAIDRFEGLLALVEARLGASDWVSGGRIGLADVMVGHLLFRYFDIDIPRRAFPRVEALYERYRVRPAYRAHVMTSYEPLRVAGA